KSTPAAMVVRRGDISTKPSDCSRRNASRIGMWLTPNFRSRSPTRIRSPGLIVPVMMARRRRSVMPSTIVCGIGHGSWICSFMISNLARSVVTRGEKTCFFITVDYALGHSLEADATAAVIASGGKVLGSARHPLNTPDFSSYLLQAQSSGAQVVALANAGGDMINAAKQANEFGLTRTGQTVVSRLAFITDIHTMGLKASQGLTFITAFYWDRDDESRAWSKRFFELHKRMPTMAQAAIYSAVRHYLRAIEAAGTDEAKAVMAKMREIPVNDFYAKNGRVREDGRMVHDMYFVQVKTPEESSGPWDYYKILSTIPGDQAFRPLDEGGCPLVKQR